MKQQTKVVVAIDGAARSGKSTVSSALAKRLGVERLDTGAMYRAVTWEALYSDVDLSDGDALAAIAREADIDVRPEMVVINGHDVTTAIRSAEVSEAVSKVAANEAVRVVLVERQRRWIDDRQGGVVEGRDIGSVVAPDADAKIYLTASREERQRRRKEESADCLASRDHIDSTRDASPLTVPEGAKVIDTTDQSVDDVVEEILRCL